MLNQSLSKRFKPSFATYFVGESTRLSELGLERNLDYPTLNGQVGGLVYNCFKVLTQESKVVLQKFENEKVEQLIGEYMEILLPQLEIFMQDFLTMLKRVQTSYCFGQIGELAKKRQLKEIVITLQEKTQDILDYYNLNLAVVIHILRKIVKEVEVVDMNLDDIMVYKLLLNKTFNVFFCAFHCLEMLHSFKVYIDHCKEDIQKSPQSPDTIGELSAILTKIEEWIKSSEEHLKDTRSKNLETFMETPDYPKTKIDTKENQILGKVVSKCETARKEYHEKTDHEPYFDYRQDPPAHLPKSHVLHEDHFQNYFVDLAKAITLSTGLDGDTKTNVKSMLVNSSLIIARSYLFYLYYYGFLPSFPAYLESVGIPGWSFGLVFSIAPVFSFFGDYLINTLFSRSYRRGIIICQILFLIGMALHFVGAGIDSLIIIIISRVFIGFSEGEALANSYMCREIPVEKMRTIGYFFSAVIGTAFVTGTGLNALLETVVSEFYMGNLLVDETNILPFVLFWLNIPLTVIFWRYFKDAEVKGQRLQGRKMTKKLSMLHTERQALKTEGYQFELSTIVNALFLPIKLTTEDTIGEKIQADREKMKREAREKKLILVKRYFAKDQVGYLAGYFFFLMMLFESFTIESPYYLYTIYKMKTVNIGLIFFCAILLVPIVTSGAVWMLRTKTKLANSQLLNICTFMMIPSVLIRICYSSQEYPLPLFIVFLVPQPIINLFSMQLILQILTELSSDKELEKTYGAGFIRAMMMDGGRTTAGILVTMGIAICTNNPVYFPNWVYGLGLVAMVGLYYWLGKVKTRMDQSNL